MIHAFQDRRMDKDRQSVLQEIWFDTKASDPPRSHGFAHEFSRREKDEKGRQFLALQSPKIEIMLPAWAGSNIFGREMARQVDKRSSRCAFGSEFGASKREGTKDK